MSQLVAVLAYTREAVGREYSSVPIGRTSDPAVLRALRNQLMAEAEGEAEMWQAVDPVLGGMATSEVERLERVFEVLLPTEADLGGIRLVEDVE